jgi:hypothetical protein
MKWNRMNNEDALGQCPLGNCDNFFCLRIRISNVSLNFSVIREGPNTYSPSIGLVESEYQ